MNTQSVNISLYQKGDVSLEDIYKRYKSCFIRYAVRVMSDEFYAEDVVQDVFTELFRQTNYYVSEVVALKYIYTAVYNRCVDLLRHRQTIQRYEKSCIVEHKKQKAEKEYNNLQTIELLMIVEYQIEKLSPKCREIFVMKYRDEYSNPKISHTLGLSLRTVENQIYIARNVLRKYVNLYLCS